MGSVGHKTMADEGEPPLYTVFVPQKGVFARSRGARALLLLAMFLGAGLVLSGCGDDDTATTPAPAPPPPPPAPEPEPEPMAPATPAGLHVDETTASSITWHWSASEGAIGYVVQQNMDGEWDETDTVMFDGVPFTTETHYTATDLEPETMVYVRVAAAAGTPAMPLVSDFSEAVSGTSAMPPPVPTPFMVEFSVPDEAKVPYPMIPDDDDDEATAMAMVNPQMMVTVNMPAIVSSTFVEGAAPIGLIPGANVPFLYVDWDAIAEHGGQHGRHLRGPARRDRGQPGPAAHRGRGAHHLRPVRVHGGPGRADALDRQLEGVHGLGSRACRSRSARWTTT